MTKTVTTGKATDLITFTRSSTGTYLDSVKYGDELVTNGTFDDGLSNWSNFNAVISVDDGQLVVDDTADAGGDSQAYQDINTTAGKYYKLSFDKISTTSVFWFAVGVPANYSQVYYSGSLGTQTGQHVLVFKATGPITRIALISSATGITRYDNCSVKEVIGNQGTSGEPLLRTADTNEPRIEYDADGNLKGLLIEEQRTNLHPKSGELTNWTYSNNLFKYEDVTTAPDGTNTADSLVPTTELSSHFTGLPQSISTGSGSETFSVFVKANGYSKIKLYLANQNGNNNQLFDISEGTSGTSGSDLLGKSIESMGNGWYRCSITYTSTKTNPYPSVALLADNYSNTSAGDGVKGIYIWGAQIESGTFPTSYIPTSGSTATRTNEQASLNASLFEYNGNEGTTLIEFDKANWAYTTTFPRAYSWGHGSQSVDILNEVYNYGNSAPNSGKIRFRVDDSSGNAVFGANFIDGSESDNTAKVALALKDNDMAIAWKGTVPHTDTTGSPAIDLVTKLYIGSKFVESSSVVNDFINGHIKSIKYYPIRLTNDEIKALTL